LNSLTWAFAGPIVADQRNDLTGAHGEVDAFEDVQRPEPFMDAPRLQHGNIPIGFHLISLLTH